MFSISQFRKNVQVVRPNLFFAEVDLPSSLALMIRERITEAPGDTEYKSTNQSFKLSGSATLKGDLQNWYKTLNQGGVTLNDTFRFRCEATELPGKTISTADDQAYGPTTKYAYETGYQDVNLQIICSEDMRERAVFEVWMENILNQTNLRQGFSSRAGLSKYYNQYASGQVRIVQVSSDRRQLALYTLYNAYPIQMSPMNLTWEEQNTYQRFTITMTYRFHLVDFKQGYVVLPGDPAPSNLNPTNDTGGGTPSGLLTA